MLLLHLYDSIKFGSWPLHMTVLIRQREKIYKYIYVYVKCVCMHVYEENSMYHFSSDLGEADGIFMMTRVGKHRLNRCEGTLRMTVWPKQLMRRGIYMGNIQLYHARTQATAAVFHRNTVSSKKQQLRENSRDAYGIHPALKVHSMPHLHGWNGNSHQLQTPTFGCIFLYSFISSQWNTNADCLHSSQILVSRIFYWLCNTIL